MYYTDFNGLIILAIGCSIVYIVNGSNKLSGKNKRNNFFLFLDMIDSVKDVIEMLKVIKEQIPTTLETLKKIKNNPRNPMKMFEKLPKEVTGKILELKVNDLPLTKFDKEFDESINYCELFPIYSKTLLITSTNGFKYGESKS
jgi:hypothetical protein